MSDLPPIQSISGGSHGVEAGYEQMLALADKYDSHAADFVEMAGLGLRVMSNGDLLESAILSPLSFADAEVQLLDATTGVNGLTVRALGIEADAMGVRAVVAAFQASDALGHHTMEMLDNALGRVIGITLPVLLLAGGIGGFVYYQTLSPQEQKKLLDDLPTDVGQLLHDHPELAQHLINSGGGLLEGLGLPVGVLSPGGSPIDGATTNDAARLLAWLAGNDTDYTVQELELPRSGDSELTPGSLEDLVRQLDRTNALDAAKDANGESPLNGAIQIQQLGSGNSARYIVYIPGTDDMGPVPGNDETVRDMETNYQLIGGMDSAYGRGITEAMREAGLSGKDVTLVGHSQGGMVATSLSADPGFASEFNVRHVITAGSPTAQVGDLPPGTHAIHFENRGDAVPMLDGEDNPDQPNRTTVKFDEGSADTGDNHEIEHYANGAKAADASGNGSIRDQIQLMEQDGFLGGEEVTEVRTYQIKRAEP